MLCDKTIVRAAQPVLLTVEMEPNKAKRRIQPIPLTSEEAGASLKSGTKRKIEETDGIPFINSVSSTDQDEGRKIKRRKNHSTSDMKVDPKLLDPLLLLITEPPVVVARGLKTIGEWMTFIINRDKAPGDYVVYEEACLSPQLPKEQHDMWSTVFNTLNEPSKFEANVTKFSFANKILCLHPEDTWSKENAAYCKLYSEVWWVKMFRKYFEKTSSSGIEDFIQTGMAALTAELFYRFVWARHTVQRYNYLAEKYKDCETTNAEEELKSDEVVDQDDLGEGSSESGSEASDVSGIESDWEEEDENQENDEEMDVDPFKESSAFQDRFLAGHSDPILNHWPEEIENFNTDFTEDYDDMAEAAALFFTHPNITVAIDELESVFFDSEATWNIEKAIEAFVKLIEYKNRATPAKITLSRSQIRGHVLHLYKGAFIPILEKLGITTSGENNYVWKWHPEFCLTYVDQVYIPTFRNLTHDGAVPHSQTFLTLFPKLFMLHDNTTDSSLHQVYSRIKSRLEYKGDITPELDNLLHMMDELTGEKRAILQKNKEDGLEDEDDNVECEDEEEEERRLAERLRRKSEQQSTTVASEFAHLMKQKIIATRNNRLKEVDEMIDKLQIEINKITGSADLVAPKTRKSKPKKISTDELINENNSNMNNLNID